MYEKSGIVILQLFLNRIFRHEKKYLFFTDAPQANNKLLGVLDSENNLRIYENRIMT